MYVGELGGGEALDWGGEFNIGNTPKRIGPEFPSASTKAWRLLHRAIKANELAGQQVDWGAVATRVTVDEIRWFVGQCYGTDVPADLVHFIASLDPARRYALVAAEQ